MNKEWQHTLETGHASIDHHHKELFHLVSLLDTAIDDRKASTVEKLILFLEDYVLTHFEEEETLMVSHDYDGYDEHHAEHQRFRQTVAELRRYFDQQQSGGLLYYQIRRFIDELVIHILTIDVKMRSIQHGDTP